MQKFPNRILICVLLGTVLCGQALSAPKLLPQSPKPLRHKGFTVLPFAERGWFVVKRSPYRLVLARHGTLIDESFAVVVGLFKLPQFEGNRSFVKYIKTGQRTTTKSDRFRRLKVRAKIHQTEKARCVYYHTRVEDHAAKRRSNKTGPMILEIVGYTCQHPVDPRVGINISISKRYYPGSQDKKLMNKARKLLQRTTFTKF